MKIRSLTIFFICSNLLISMAWSRSHKASAHLHLKGIVPVQTTIDFRTTKDGALVPTLISNAPTGYKYLPKVNMLRVPASVGGAEKVVISSP